MMLPNCEGNKRGEKNHSHGKAEHISQLVLNMVSKKILWGSLFLTSSGLLNPRDNRLHSAKDT